MRHTLDAGAHGARAARGLERDRAPPAEDGGGPPRRAAVRRRQDGASGRALQRTGRHASGDPAGLRVDELDRRVAVALVERRREHLGPGLAVGGAQHRARRADRPAGLAVRQDAHVEQRGAARRGGLRLPRLAAVGRREHGGVCADDPPGVVADEVDPEIPGRRGGCQSRQHEESARQRECGDDGHTEPADACGHEIPLRASRWCYSSVYRPRRARGHEHSEQEAEGARPMECRAPEVRQSARRCVSARAARTSRTRDWCWPAGTGRPGPARPRGRGRRSGRSATPWAGTCPA